MAPIFRADQVGSLLRPRSLLEIRTQNNITASVSDPGLFNLQYLQCMSVMRPEPASASLLMVPRFPLDLVHVEQ